MQEYKSVELLFCEGVEGEAPKGLTFIYMRRERIKR